MPEQRLQKTRAAYQDEPTPTPTRVIDGREVPRDVYEDLPVQIVWPDDIEGDEWAV